MMLTLTSNGAQRRALKAKEFRQARVDAFARALCDRFGDHDWDQIPAGALESQEWWLLHADELLRMVGK